MTKDKVLEKPLHEDPPENRYLQNLCEICNNLQCQYMAK